MAKLAQIIQAFVANQETVPVYKPGSGYVMGKVKRLDDDVVTITPQAGDAYIIHTSQFSVERD